MKSVFFCFVIEPFGFEKALIKLFVASSSGLYSYFDVQVLTECACSILQMLHIQPYTNPEKKSFQ